jgi:hypothetical protein
MVRYVEDFSAIITRNQHQQNGPTTKDGNAHE